MPVSTLSGHSGELALSLLQGVSSRDGGQLPGESYDYDILPPAMATY